jgi:hypothetical protein
VTEIVAGWKAVESRKGIMEKSEAHFPARGLQSAALIFSVTCLPSAGRKGFIDWFSRIGEKKIEIQEYLTHRKKRKNEKKKF